MPRCVRRAARAIAVDEKLGADRVGHTRARAGALLLASWGAGDTVLVRSSRGPSWQLRFDDLPALLVAAMYVRDVVGLSVAGSPPPLVPSIATDPAARVPVAAAEEWARWWQALLTVGDRDVEAMRRAVMAGEDPLSPPVDLIALTPLMDQFGHQARRWASDVRREAHLVADGALAPRARGGPEPLLVTRLVAEMERAAGRPARPFVFRVDVLPVAGPWWTSHTPNHVLVGQEVIEDSAAWRDLLRELLTPLV